MTGQVGQGTELVDTVLVLVVVLMGFRIMLGRATVPVLVVIALCALSSLFPNDPLAHMVSRLTCQLGVPVLLLWGLYHFLLKPLVAPHGNRNSK